MYEQDKDAADGRWFGVQEAASYLGMHRATLFRAIKSGLIVADRTTPRGRARFRQDTIDAYRDTLRRQAAAGQDHVYAPVRIMAQLAKVLATPSSVGDPRAALDEALCLLRPPHGSYDMVAVGLHSPRPTDPHALDFPAEYGFPDRLKAAYECLRPHQDFPVNISLRTGMPQICDDIHRHPFPNATTMRALVQSGVLAYAVLPITTGAGWSMRTVGVLCVCRRASHKFSQQELVFLGGVADALSACIAQGVLVQGNDTRVLTPGRALAVASEFLDPALLATRCPSIFSPATLPVVSLCNHFIEQSNALATWVDGFPPHACGDTASKASDDDLLLMPKYRGDLRDLVSRARTDDGVQRAQWENRVTAVALPVQLPSRERGAVGAIWRGVREDIAAEKILLSTLATACSRVSE